MNLTKMLPIIAAGLLFVGSLTSAVAVQAQGAKPVDVGVHNLNTRAGVAAVYHRIRGIAVGHCTRSVEQAPDAQCVSQVMEQLLGRVADPYLSYLHENPEDTQIASR